MAKQAHAVQRWLAMEYERWQQYLDTPTLMLFICTVENS